MNEEQGLPRNKAELLSQIEAEWSALMGVVAKLDGTQMITPDAGGWSPKDHLVHISEWMNFMLDRHMDKRPAHVVMSVLPEIIEDWDVDRINKIFFERNRDRAVKDVVDELKTIYARAIEKLTSTPFEDLLRPLLPERADSPSLLVMGILNNTRDHFAEHRETLEKVLAKKAGS